jgi:hypothetical protein
MGSKIWAESGSEPPHLKAARGTRQTQTRTFSRSTGGFTSSRGAPLTRMRPDPCLQWATAVAVFLRPKTWTAGRAGADWQMGGKGGMNVRKERQERERERERETDRERVRKRKEGDGGWHTEERREGEETLTHTHWPFSLSPLPLS